MSGKEERGFCLGCLRESIRTIVVSRGSCNQLPQTGLKSTEIDFFTLLGTDVQSWSRQGCAPVEGSIFLHFLQFWGPQHFWAWGHVPPISASTLMWPSPLCPCVFWLISSGDWYLKNICEAPCSKYGHILRFWWTHHWWGAQFHPLKHNVPRWSI